MTRNNMFDVDMISIHALREEGDCRVNPQGAETVLFLSTPSARRATAVEHFSGTVCADFYPRPPRGGRLASCFSVHCIQKFLSTPSARRATQALHARHPHRCISIHALREEGDQKVGCFPSLFGNFYPRPPRGGRPEQKQSTALREVFLSTPSARRATCMKVTRITWTPYFYPRPPRGGRPVTSQNGSILEVFLSTPSARRATCCLGSPERFWGDFYPRPPRGGRRSWPIRRNTFHRFLSTPSARRATLCDCFQGQLHRFLSTPSARRATLWGF